MNDAITEVGSKNLAVLWFGNDECDTGGWIVRAAVNLIDKPDKILAMLQHVVDSAGRATLVLQALVVSLEHILVRNHILVFSY